MDQEKIKQIATKVMGWLKDGQYLASNNPWNPYESWADCGMVIDRMSELGIDISGCLAINIHGADLKTAICEAALKAVS